MQTSPRGKNREGCFFTIYYYYSHHFLFPSPQLVIICVHTCRPCQSVLPFSPSNLALCFIAHWIHHSNCSSTSSDFFQLALSHLATEEEDPEKKCLALCITNDGSIYTNIFRAVLFIYSHRRWILLGTSYSTLSGTQSHGIQAFQRKNSC